MHKLFPSQSDAEKVYIAVREHWIVLAMRVAVWSILLIVYVAFYVIGKDVLPGLFQGDAGIIVSIFSKLYIIFLLLSLFIIFVLYYLNLHIITDIRIVDIDQEGLFSHVVSELHLDKIEDVTSQTNGVLANVFDYGTVLIQTAGATERFEFKNVPNPAILTKIILDLYEKRSTNSAKALPDHKPLS